MALANANLDTRMTDVVANIVSTWQSWGMGMFNYFIMGESLGRRERVGEMSQALGWA